MIAACPCCHRPTEWTFAALTEGSCTTRRAVSACCYATRELGIPRERHREFFACKSTEAITDWDTADVPETGQKGVVMP